jgi:hypothetical protein
MNTRMSIPNSAQLTGGNGPGRAGNSSHRRIIATVLVGVILNVSRKTALKLNAQQLRRALGFDSAGITGLSGFVTRISRSRDPYKTVSGEASKTVRGKR